jgi:Ceramidase
VAGTDHAYGKRILALMALAAVVAVALAGRIPQDPGYHQFADARSMLGIPNFLNCCSNLPFLLAGIYGLWRAPRLSQPRTRAGYWVLCLGVLLVAAGSSYYHYAPSNAALVWDRLPMTVAFMALFSLLLDERVFPASAPRTLWPLLAAGVGSVAYWYWTESRGAGDLRPYALVQFLPMLLIPAILALFQPRYLRGAMLVAALVLYALAKVFEHFDAQLYAQLGHISGHSLKHVASGLAVFFIIHAVPARRIGAA